jgi:hypothetical protein
VNLCVECGEPASSPGGLCPRCLWFFESLGIAHHQTVAQDKSRSESSPSIDERKPPVIRTREKYPLFRRKIRLAKVALYGKEHGSCSTCGRPLCDRSDIEAFEPDEPLRSMCVDCLRPTFFAVNLFEEFDGLTLDCGRKTRPCLLNSNEEFAQFEYPQDPERIDHLVRLERQRLKNNFLARLKEKERAEESRRTASKLKELKARVSRAANDFERTAAKAWLEIHLIRAEKNKKLAAIECGHHKMRPSEIIKAASAAEKKARLELRKAKEMARHARRARRVELAEEKASRKAALAEEKAAREAAIAKQRAALDEERASRRAALAEQRAAHRTELDEQRAARRAALAIETAARKAALVEENGDINNIALLRASQLVSQN